MMENFLLRRCSVILAVSFVALLMVSTTLSVAAVNGTSPSDCAHFVNNYSDAQAFDVFLYIENSNESYDEIQARERQEFAHLVADMLLVDGHIRDVEHRLAVRTYAVAPLERIALTAVSDANIDELHEQIEQIANRGGQIGSEDHIENLFENISNRVKEAENPTLVLVINDMSPNGETENDFAQDAYDQWIENQPENGVATFIYMIDTNPNRANDSQFVIESWQKHFFALINHGDIRTITHHNRLFEFRRILEEVTGDKIFHELTANPPPLIRCKFEEKLEYALVFDRPLDSGSQTDQMFPSGVVEIARGRSSVIKHIDFPANGQIAQMPNIEIHDTDIFYAIKRNGNLSGFQCPSPFVASAGYGTVMLPESSEEFLLIWGPDGSLEDQEKENVTSTTTITVGSVTKDEPYKLTVQSLGSDVQEGASEECHFTVVPVPDIRILSLAESPPPTVTVVVEHANKLRDENQCPKVTFNDQLVDWLRAENGNNNDLLCHYDLPQLDNNSEGEAWRINAYLQVETVDGIQVSLQSQRSIVVTFSELPPVEAYPQQLIGNVVVTVTDSMDASTQFVPLKDQKQSPEDPTNTELATDSLVIAELSIITAISDHLILVPKKRVWEAVVAIVILFLVSVIPALGLSIWLRKQVSNSFGSSSGAD